MTIETNVLVREATTAADDELTVNLNIEYLTWFFLRFSEELGISVPPVEENDVRETLEKFRRPTGMVLLAEINGESAGVVAIRTLREGVLEIKRMYVRPGWRGARIGSALLDRALQEASSMGATIVLLDTNKFMTDAQRLYRSRGFSERTPYEGTEIPTDVQKYWLFFEKDMTNDPGRDILPN